MMKANIHAPHRTWPLGRGLIALAASLCAGICHGQQDDATPATREEIAACQSEYEALHAVAYPMRRARSDATWAAWSATKRKLHQEDRDRDLAGEHDLYIFNQGSRYGITRRDLTNDLARFKRNFSQYKGAEPYAVLSWKAQICTVQVRLAKLDGKPLPNDSKAALHSGSTQPAPNPGFHKPVQPANGAGTTGTVVSSLDALAGGASGSAAPPVPAAATSGNLKQHNPAHDAVKCIAIYNENELKARGYKTIKSSMMVNTCPYSVSVQWCVEAGNGHRGDCKPGYANLWDLGPNATWGIDSQYQSVHYAACRKGPGMGFNPVELDPRNPYRFSCS
jgi:hypothetical protein